MTFDLPWPPSRLNPNVRQHWTSLARHKRRYRDACRLTAMSQGAAKIEAERLTVTLQFVPPDRRKRDLDNCIAAMKSGLDGLADALGVDDNKWRLAAILVDGEIGGFVRVTVE
jgi:crossover junction endodeoxyribonuclease RusA